MERDRFVALFDLKKREILLLQSYLFHTWNAKNTLLFPPPHAMIAIINKKNCIYFEKISNLDIKNSSIFSVLARKNESS
jgi:hypothetical protein